MPDKSKIKLIHVLKTKLGLTDDEYRILLGTYKVESSKDLSAIQAQHLIDTMYQLAKARGISTRAAGDSARSRWFASPSQLRLIDARWHDVSRAKTAEERSHALNVWLHKQFGFGGLNMVPRSKVGAIIYAIKQMTQQKDSHTNEGEQHHDDRS